MRKYFVIIIFLIVPFVSFSQVTTTTEEQHIYTGAVEVMPEYPGGLGAMIQFISSSIKYPKSAKEKKIEGKVYVSFVIDTTGKATNIKIVRGADSLLDAEAIRVINSFPLWNPGKEKGKLVNVLLTVPINFTVY